VIRKLALLVSSTELQRAVEVRMEEQLETELRKVLHYIQSFHVDEPSKEDLMILLIDIFKAIAKV
jgi:hypothetical protein